MHDPASGSAAQTFNRTTSTGGTTPITKMSAAAVTVRDAAIVTGANTPFDEITDSIAAKTVEACLADIRKNTGELKNFDHYGGIAGAGISAANAAKNTEVLAQIVSDITADGQVNGIFFPGSQYEFMEFGGNMPRIASRPNIRFVGTGAGTIFQRNTNGTTNQDLMTFVDCPQAQIADIWFERAGTTGTGSCLRFSGSATTDIGNIKVLSCYFGGGAGQIVMQNAAANGIISTYWITNCTFGTPSANSISVVEGAYGHILANDFLGGGAGISVTSAGGANSRLLDSEIVGNIFRTAGQTITVTRSGVYNASNHRGLTVRGNKITSGNMAITGVEEVEVLENKVYAGQITVICDMATATNPRIIGNTAKGATGAGIQLIGVNSTINGFEVSGNHVQNATQQGILIAPATTPARCGVISNNRVIDCSRENSGVTDYSGIYLFGPDAGGGVIDSIVEHNVIRCFSFTAGGNGHDFGVDEQGGVSNRNMVGPNFIKGYISADVRVSGAGSLDVVAAVTASVATYARFDGGAAV